MTPMVIHEQILPARTWPSPVSRPCEALISRSAPGASTSATMAGMKPMQENSSTSDAMPVMSTAVARPAVAGPVGPAA